MSAKKGALRFVLPLISGLLVWTAAESAQAQYHIPYQNSGARSARSRLLQRPTVSPYLELLSPDARVGLPTYYTRVKPQLETEEIRRQAARQFQSLQQQVQSVQRQEAQLSQDIGTGHPTRFQNHLHYYPLLGY